MAKEKVIIKGGELDGSMLENAATEATLLRLVNAYEKISGPGTGGKVKDTHDKALKNTSKATTELGESFNKAKTAVDNFSSGMTGFISSTLGTIVSGATFAVRSFTDFLSSSFSNYREIADTGVTFGNNMIEVSRAALNAGMTMSGFTDMIKKNNTVLMALGGTASDGAERLAKLRDGIINSDLGTRFYGLGLTTKDIEGYMGSYLDQLQKTGSLQRRDNASLTKGLSLYVEELDKVTKLTGIERKRLDEQARKAALDPIFDALRRGLNPEQFAKSTANLAMVAEMGGDELQQAIKEIATGVQNSDLSKQLVSFGAITQKEALAISQGTAEATPILQKALDNLNRQGVLADSGILSVNAGLRDANVIRMKLMKLQDADYKKAKAEQEKRNALTSAFGKIPAVFDNIRNKIFGAFISSGLFDRVVKALNEGAEQLETYLNPIVAWFGALFNNMKSIADQKGLGEALKYGITRIFEEIKNSVLPEVIKIFNAMIKPLVDSISNGIRSLFGLKNKQASPQNPLTAPEGTNQPDDQTFQLPSIDLSIFDDIIKRIGKMKDSFMDLVPTWEDMKTYLGYGAAGGVGLIVGLSLLGGALWKVVAPASALALAIGVGAGAAGAGLSMAFEQAGKMVEKFTSSFEKLPKIFKDFENIDASKLGGVGKGLAELSGPLLATGTASLLMGLSGDKGLPALADALIKFQSIDGSNFEKLGGPLKKLHQALEPFTVKSFMDFISGMAGSAAGDQGLGALANAFNTFSKVDPSVLSSLGGNDGPLAKMYQGLKNYLGISIAQAFGALISPDQGLGALAKSLTEFSSLDSGKLVGLGGASGPLAKFFEGVTVFFNARSFSGSIGAFLSADQGLGALAKALKEFASVDGAKLVTLGGAQGPLATFFEGITVFFNARSFSGSIGAMLSSDQGLSALAKALTAFSSVDAGKLQSLGGAQGPLASFFEGISTFLSNQTLSSAFVNLINPDQGLSSLAKSLTAFSSVDAGKLQSLGGAQGPLAGFFEGISTFIANQTLSSAFSSIISSDQGLGALAAVLNKFESLDAGKLQSLGGAQGPLAGFFEGISTFIANQTLSSAFSSIISTDQGLGALASVLAKFESLDAGKIKALGGAQGPLASFFEGISTFISNQSLSTAFVNLINPDQGLGALASVLAKFESLDAGKIKALGGAQGPLASFFEGISTFLNNQTISTTFLTLVNPDQGLGALASVLNKFESLDVGKIQSLGGSDGPLAKFFEGISTFLSNQTLSTTFITLINPDQGLGALVSVLNKFESLDVGKLQSLGGADGPLAKFFVGISTFLSGKDITSTLTTLVNPDQGLGALANALLNFNNLNADKISGVAQPLKELYNSLSLFTGNQGFISSLTSAFGSWLSGDKGIGAFADSFKKFNEIDSNNLKNTVSAISDVRTVLGEEFKNQATNVNAFATSIKNLTNDLSALKVALDKLSSTGGAAGGRTSLEVVASEVTRMTGSGAGATNSLIEEQKKLNILIAELKPVFEATRDNTKETADKVNGRMSVTGP